MIQRRDPGGIEEPEEAGNDNCSALAQALTPGPIFAMRVEIEKEDDGRWIAEVPQLPGAMPYGSTKEEAVVKVEALVLRLLADKIEHGEFVPELGEVFTVAA